MADIVSNLLLDNSQAVAAIDKYRESIRGAVADTNKLQTESTESFKEGGKEAERFADKLDKGGEGVKKFGEAQKQAKKEGNGFLKELINQTRGVTVFGVSVGDVTDKVTNFAKGVQALGVAGKRSVPGLKAGSLAVRGLYAAATLGLATVIAGIVSAFTALAAALTRTQGGIEVVRVAFAGVQAVFNVIIDRIAILGTAVVKVFQGDFEGAAEAARSSMEGIGEEISTEIELTRNLEKALIDIEKRETDLALARAKGNVELTKLRFITEDVSNSLEDRIAAGEKALQIEEGLIAEERRLNELRIANILGFTELNEEAFDKINRLREGVLTLDEIGLTISTEADREQLTEYITTLSNLEVSSLNLRKEINNQLNSIRKEAAANAATVAEENRKAIEAETAARQEALQSFSDFVTGIMEEVDRIDYQNLSPRQQVITDFQNKIDEIDKTAQEAILRAKELGTALPQELLNGLDRARQAARAQAEAALDEINKGFTQVAQISEGLPPLPTGLVREFTREELQEAQSFSKRLTDALNLTDEDLKLLEQSAKDGLNLITQSITESTQAQIKQQDQLLASLDNRISAVQNALNLELELKKAGYANDFEAQKQNLDQLQKAREEAENRRIELAKKAARQQLIIEAAQQASSLATSAANFIKSNSSIPVVGIALAVSAIATMFSLFAKAKAIAGQAAGGIELADGMIGIPGPSHDTQKRGGKKMRIEGTPYLIEGGESVINKRATAEHEGFLRALNNNEFKGVNLDAIGKMLTRRPTMVGKAQQALNTYDKGVMLKAIADAQSGGQVKELKKLQKQMKQLIAASENSIHYVPDGKLKRIERGRFGERVTRIN